MVDVSDKPVTHRTATAAGSIQVSSEIMAAVKSGNVKKGDVLGVARVAGIMGVKRTSELIPMCHPLPIQKCSVDFETDEDAGMIRVFCTVKTEGKTGVEMEALTDNGVGSANYVSYNAFTAGITSSSEDVCNKIWNMKWTVIRRCCRFMEHYQQATVAPDAAPHEGIQTVDRFAAEARALRAFYHFCLLYTSDAADE